MKITLVSLLCIGLGLAMCIMSCEQTLSADSPEIVEEGLMMNILIDFHLAEAIAGKKGGQPSHREMLRKDLQDEVLERYGLDKETFYHSYKYYLEHPVVLDSIYSNIIRIMEAKSKDEKDKYIPSAKKDSTPKFTKKRLPQTEE